MPKKQHIPSTGRRASFQARQLGHGSVADFARLLPENALVVDVGAGFSQFGHEVAALRADVRWVNVDSCYVKESTIVDKDLPNLEFLADDIVKGSVRLKKMRGQADLVYSYWLLPHLSLETDAPARAAVSAMYELLKPSGRLAIGPIKQVGLGFLSPWRYKGTHTYTKKQSKDEVIDDSITRTKLWWLPRLVQRFCNRHSLHIGARLVGGGRKTARIQ